MANNVTNYVQVVGSEEVIQAMDEKFKEAGGYGDTDKFVNAFYGTDFEGGVKFDWLYENVGSKWIYVETEIDAGNWNIQSANYTPKEFWIHLYKMAAEIDPKVEIEVKFMDEGYYPIGGFVVKKDHKGVPAWSMEEDYDVEDPTESMDWEDEDYDSVQMDFMDDLEDGMTGLMNYAHDTIWSGEGNKLEE